MTHQETAALLSAESSKDGKTVTLGYSLELEDPSGETIAIAANGTAITVSSVALDPADAKNIIVTLATPIAAASDMITATYASSNILTLAGGPVTTFADLEVANNLVISSFVAAVYRWFGYFP